MLNSETLEIAIGMAFLFLPMALTCTAIKDWIEGVLKWWAMDLECALRTLLDDPDGYTTSFLYRHPQIFSLFQGTYDPAHLTSSMLTLGKGALHMHLWHRRNLPSDIPLSHFSTAFLDLVGRGPSVGGSFALSNLCQKMALILLHNFCWELLNATEPARVLRIYRRLLWRTR